MVDTVRHLHPVTFGGRDSLMRDADIKNIRDFSPGVQKVVDEPAAERRTSVADDEPWDGVEAAQARIQAELDAEEQLELAEIEKTIAEEKKTTEKDGKRKPPPD